MEKAKIWIAAIGGTIAAWLGDVYVLILLTLGFMILDYMTGVLAAGYEHNINSEKATNGLYKKAGFLLLLLLGMGLDIAVEYFSTTTLSISLPFSSPFGLIICAWIVITESISVIENLSRLGAKIPAFLANWLKITQDSIDNSGDHKEG
jgi:toxin secretion/phage lysis holin